MLSILTVAIRDSVLIIFVSLFNFLLEYNLLISPLKIAAACVDRNITHEFTIPSSRDFSSRENDIVPINRERGERERERRNRVNRRIARRMHLHTARPLFLVAYDATRSLRTLHAPLKRRYIYHFLVPRHFSAAPPRSGSKVLPPTKRRRRKPRGTSHRVWERNSPSVGANNALMQVYSSQFSCDKLPLYRKINIDWKSK